MYKLITSLTESPCFECPFRLACNKKVERVPALQEIVEYVWPKRDFPRENCSLWNSFMREGLDNGILR